MSAHSSSRSAALIHRSRPSLLSRVQSALAVYRQRLHLARLDDAALDDIGLTRQDALQEARRPVWDAPDRWRC